MAGTAEVPFFSLLSSRSALPPAVSLAFLLPRPLTLSSTTSSCALFLCPRAPVKGTRRRKRESEKREQTGGAGRKAAGEGGAGGLERTRSPFTLLPGLLGRYLSTARRRARAFVSFSHRRVPRSHKLACSRVYVHARERARERAGHVRSVRGEREREMRGRETAASLAQRRPRALHTTQRRANPMGP